MLDRTLAYNILYALVARDGRESALFGTCAPLALLAFEQSLACNDFPELWFELPLLGEPWFDFHALTSRESLRPDMTFDPKSCGGYPRVFEWFAAQKDVRQLALSWDTGRGDVSHPAIQLLVSTRDSSVTCSFLEVAERGDAAPAYRSFVSRMPEGWYACYAGVFPGRAGHNLRVECIPSRQLQRAYVQDPALMAEHLQQVGVHELGDTVVSRCQRMMQAPFPFEFQFDVEPDGSAGTTLGASSRFDCPPGTDDYNAFDPEGAAGELMGQAQEWGLADDRWRLLAQTMFAQHLSYGGKGVTLYCYPAFLKLRWHDGNPVDAKAYLIAGTQ